MALPPSYRASIGVVPTNPDRVVLPEVGDPGRAISGVGRSLLNMAEPILTEKAEREAIQAAGVAGIVKVGDSFQRAEPMPEGAGRVYAQVYNRAVDQRLTHQITKSFEARLATWQAEFQDDPAGFQNAAEGAAKGVLEATAPEIRAEVEVNLTREWSERLRGLAERKVVRDRQNLVAGHSDMAREQAREVGLIIATGAADWRDRAADVIARFETTAGTLRDIGALSDEGHEAMLLSLRNLTQPLVLETVSKENRAAFGEYLQRMNNTELAALAAMGSGVPAPGFPVMLRGEDGSETELRWESFLQLFPEEGVRGSVGQVASTTLNQRLEVERQQAAAEAEAQRLALQQAQLSSSNAILSAVRESRYDPALGYTEGQIAAIETQVEAAGPLFEQFASAEGRGRLLSIISETGYLPKGLVQHIDAQITGGNFAAVAEFVQDFRTFYARGTHAGQLAYEQLSPQTRAAIELDETLRAGGYDEATRYSMLDDARRKRAFSEDEAKAAVTQTKDPAGRNRNYVAFRDSALASHYNGAFKGNPVVARDFDKLFRFNLQIHDGNVEAAAGATARSVARMWKPDTGVVGGIAPAKFDTARREMGLTWGNIIPLVPGMSTEQRAAAGRGTYRMRFLSDNRGTGYGQWEMVPRTDDGRPLPPLRFNMDEVMGAAREIVWRSSREYQDQQRQAQIRAGALRR